MRDEPQAQSHDARHQKRYKRAMSVLSPTELKSAVPKGKTYLGLDIGSKTIGVAVSDVGHMIASPRETIARTKFSRDATRLREISATDTVGGIVVGLPVEMDGSEGTRCQSVRDLTTEIVKALDLPAAFWDERLSTAAVERVLIGDADASRKRRGEVVDKMAAAWILQGFLDSAG